MDAVCKYIQGRDDPCLLPPDRFSASSEEKGTWRLYSGSAIAATRSGGMEITSLAKDCESRFSHGHPAIPETASSDDQKGAVSCDESVKSVPRNPSIRRIIRVPSLFLIIDHPSMLPASCPPSTTSSCLFSRGSFRFRRSLVIGGGPRPSRKSTGTSKKSAISSAPADGSRIPARNLTGTDWPFPICKPPFPTTFLSLRIRMRSVSLPDGPFVWFCGRRGRKGSQGL